MGVANARLLHSLVRHELRTQAELEMYILLWRHLNLTQGREPYFKAPTINCILHKCSFHFPN